MNINFIPFLVSALSCILAVNITSYFALKIGLVDVPNYRKIHTGNIPLVGGISMFVALVIGLLTTQIDIIPLKNILLAMLVALVVGALDDHKDLSIRFRIFFHIVAALIVVSTNGVILSSLGWIFGIVEFKLYSWSVFVSVFAIIGVMNAVNMSDGIDGLSGLLSIVTLSFISYFAYIGGREDLFTLALLSCSTLVPFLMFNLGIFGRSRKVFMGDAGTTFIGLLIAVLLIELSQGEKAIFKPVTALWLLAVPLLDTAAVMIRRIRNGGSPFKPDRGHLHHFFLKSSISEGKTLLIIVGLSFSMAFIGSWLELNNVAEWKMFALFLFVFFLYLLATFHAWKVVKFFKS